MECFIQKNDFDVQIVASAAIRYEQMFEVTCIKPKKKTKSGRQLRS